MRLSFQFIETGEALDSLKIVQIPKVNCFYWSERSKSEYVLLLVLKVNLHIAIRLLLWGPRICGPDPLHNRAQDLSQGE